MVNQTIPVHGISKLWLEVRQLGRAIHFYRAGSISIVAPAVGTTSIRDAPGVFACGQMI
jgi:hypothetical protein